MNSLDTYLRSYNVDYTKELTHLSLCTGYEGIGSGLRRVFPNVREVAYVEIEAFAIANLVAKMEKGYLYATPIYTDLKTFPYKEFYGKVDFLSAGFPCQPFSAAGRRASTEDPRHLYPYIAKGISECRPTYVVLENVQGIISSKTADGESVLKYVLGDLEERGYRTSWGVFSASEVGAPHQRKRVFILAHTSAQGLQGGELGETQYRETEAHDTTAKRSNDGWPARPGEEQYEWEEPRVTKRTQSELGGADDGIAGGVDSITNRVDRLRLLGNGVVPQMAERAIRVLLEKLHAK